MMTLDQYIANAINPEINATPAQKLATAVRTCESIAFAQGASLALSSIRMVATVVPASVTKTQLIHLLRSAITTAERECLARCQQQPDASALVAVVPDS